jgi:hypothetical protein
LVCPPVYPKIAYSNTLTGRRERRKKREKIEERKREREGERTFRECD